jgi:GR25 family glycosyltransferase involved in LPS biosynthesis
MNWTNIAEHIYVINLSRRNDRRRLMEYKLQRIGITSYEIFDATDGYDKKYDDIYNKTKTQFNSRGAMGLILTYIRLLEDAYLKKYTSVLLLEDDINIHIHYNSLLSLFDKIITNESYDVIWLGANQPNISDKQIMDIKTKNMYIPDPKNKNYTYGTYSIKLTQNGIVKLYQIINNHNITNLKPTDNLINELIVSNKISGVVCYPYLFIPDVSDSDNMPIRNQNEFANIRGINMDDYEYVSQNDINLLKKFIKSKLVSTSALIHIESKVSILNNIRNTITFKNISSLPKHNMNVPTNIEHVYLRIIRIIPEHNDIIKLID